MSTVDPITEISTQPLGYFCKCMHCFWKLLNFQIYDTENLSHWSTRQIHYREHWQCTAATLLKSSFNRLQPWPGGLSLEGKRVETSWVTELCSLSQKMYKYHVLLQWWQISSSVYSSLFRNLVGSQHSLQLEYTGLDLQDVSFKNSLHFLEMWQDFSWRYTTQKIEQAFK